MKISNQTIILSGIVILVVFKFMFYSPCRKEEYNSGGGQHHSHGQETNSLSIVEQLNQVIEKINEYQKEEASDPEQLLSLGMAAHHIDEIESVGTEFNPIAKMIHQDVAHDLLRMHYVIDRIIRISQDNPTVGKYQELKKEIKDTPDKNFKKSTKDKLSTVLDYIIELEKIETD
jgi:DNA repair ATPase RecN